MSAVRCLYINCTESTLYKLPSHLTLSAEVKALTFIKDALTKDLESMLGKCKCFTFHSCQRQTQVWPSLINLILGQIPGQSPSFKSMFQEVGHKGWLPLALQTGDAFAYQLSCYTHSEYISMNFCFLKLVYENAWKKKTTQTNQLQ